MGGDGMEHFEAHHLDILNPKIGSRLQGQQQGSAAGRSRTGRQEPWRHVDLLPWDLGIYVLSVSHQ